MCAKGPSATISSPTVSGVLSLIAGGNTSFRLARRSVYFHSSIRRCGRPSALNLPIASARRALTAALPGSLAATVSNVSKSACSALVFITAMFMSRRLAGVVRVTRFLEFECELLTTGLLNAPVDKHMDFVRHDIVQQTLVVRDDEESAILRTQRVDALRHDPQGVDIKA